ncbi:PK domain-containing protein [Psidium guajava]|nr:PK domain-containing protein [Psidium guajava]
MGVYLHRNGRLTGFYLLHYAAVPQKRPLRSQYVVPSAALVEDHVFDEIPEVETWKPAVTYRYEGGSHVFDEIPGIETWKPAVTYRYRREDRSHMFNENPVVETWKPAVRHACGERSKRRLFSLLVRVLKSLNWEVAWRIRFQRIVNEHEFKYSAFVLRTLVHVFAVAGMRLEVYALLRDMVCYLKEFNVDMVELTDFLLRRPADVVGVAVIYNVLIKVFAANSMLKDAKFLFSEGTKIGLEPDVYSSNFLLKCSVEADREVAEKLFDIMKDRGPAPNARTYTIMLNSLSKLNLSKDVFQSKALAILEDMNEKGISCTVVTHGTLLCGLCKVGATGVALDLIRKCQKEGLVLNNYCYNAVIYGFCQNGQLSEALGVLEEMQSYGVFPDVYSYSILIDGFCKKGDVEKSLSLFHEMEVFNIRPTIVSYSSLCHGLCKAGLMELSHGFFRDSGYRGIEYDNIAYDILIDGFLNQGHVSSANRLFQEMINHNVHPCASTFRNMISGFCQYCREGNSEEALKLDQDIFRTSYMFTTAIRRLCKEGKPEKAWELLAPMLKKNIFPDIVMCSILMHGFAKSSKLKVARKLYGKMLKAGIMPDMVMNTILINILFCEGRVDKAYTLFMEMDKGLPPDVKCYTSVLAGFCRLGDIKMAWALFRRMLRKGVLPSVFTFTSVIDGFSKNRRLDLAERLFLVMKSVGVDPDVATYNVLVSAYHRTGNMKKKEEMLLEMQKNGLETVQRMRE